MEPDLETLRVAQLRKLAPCEEECLLYGVLRPLDVPKDSVRDRVAPVTVEVDELGEGDLVAVPGPFDQPHPHGSSLSAAPQGGRFARQRWSEASEGSTSILRTLWTAAMRIGSSIIGP